MSNIIFLDIDGPMIPATSYLFNSMASYDQDLDQRCVNVLLKILDKTDAQIVLNTTHSSMLDPCKDSWPGLLNQFKKYGLYKYLHSIKCTNFPNYSDDVVGSVDYKGENHLYIDNPRLLAIKKWLDSFTYDYNWVAFDDVFIPHDNAYLVSYDDGIGIGAYNHAMDVFSMKPYSYY